MPVRNYRYCPNCREMTFQTYYPDYTHKGYAYYQCEKCGTCLYKCPVHKIFNSKQMVEHTEKICSCEFENK
jgi:ferredoxin